MQRPQRRRGGRLVVRREPADDVSEQDAARRQAQARRRVEFRFQRVPGPVVEERDERLCGAVERAERQHGGGWVRQRPVAARGREPRFFERGRGGEAVVLGREEAAEQLQELAGRPRGLGLRHASQLERGVEALAVQAPDLVRGQHAVRQHQQNDAAAVDVGAVVVVEVPCFRRAVERRPALFLEARRRARFRVRQELRGGAKVREHDARAPRRPERHQQILGLDVAVRDVSVVAVRDGAAEVAEVARRVLLRERRLPFQMRHELAARADVHQDVKVHRRLERGLDPEAVPPAAEQPEHADLAEERRRRGRGEDLVALAERHALLEDLRREPRAVALPRRDDDAREVALAELRAELVRLLELVARRVPLDRVVRVPRLDVIRHAERAGIAPPDH
mmetsp:Transcript_12435/g.38332  ORF Transcript_12435/g.38332 Transcript_12435/m.38332 type:complete len:394 (+) Transcript_12435:461-1642(+)